MRWKKKIYRRCEGRPLRIHFPEDLPAEPFAALVFLHGGGWNAGSPDKLKELAEMLGQNGVWTLLPEYRFLKDTAQGISALVGDAASAWRFGREFVYQSAPSGLPVFFGGGSAGAHLALNAWLHHPEAFAEAAAPAGWILANPVIDTSPEGFGNDLIGDEWLTYSPRHHLREMQAPVLYLQGAEDEVTCPALAETWVQKLISASSEVDWVLQEGAGHGFFNLPENRENMARLIVGFAAGCARTGPMGETDGRRA